MFLNLVLRLCSEMGKGRHQIPTKEELIKKYNHINKIKQVDFIHIRITFAKMHSVQGYLCFVSHHVLSPCRRNSQGKPGFCKTGTSTALLSVKVNFR